ncbi:MAG: Flp family type IVb pilin, partial [Litorimonas sp.]
MQNLIKNFVNDESGATAIEYGLIAALVAVAMIAGAT